MATTAITPVDLVIGTESADLLGVGTVADTPTDGWAIAAGGLAGHRMLLIFEADGTGDTVTLVAGDRPPAARAGLGNDTIVLAASDIRAIIVEGAQFIHDDGSMLATCTDSGTKCYALRLPKA